MSLGSLLLKPQVVERGANVSLEEAFADDLVTLLGRLVPDPAQGEVVIGILREELEAMAERLVDAAGDGLGTALDRIEALFKPVLDRITAFTEDPPSLDTVDEFLGVVIDVVNGGVELLEALTPTQIRSSATELLDVLEKDLGATVESFENEIAVTLEAIEQRLATAAAAATLEARATLEGVGGMVARVRREVRGGLPTVDLDSDRLAGQVIELLDRIGFDEVIERATCVAEAMRTFVGAGTTLAEMTSVVGFGPGTVGAATKPSVGDKYAWYASWLLQSKNRPTAFSLFDWLPGFPLDEVAVANDGKEVVLRKILREDEVLHSVSTPVEWHQAPLFSDPGTKPRYTFTSTLNAEFLEAWALWSAVTVDFVKAVVHTIALVREPGNEAAHASHLLYNNAHALFKAVVKAPFGSWLNAATTIGDSLAGIPEWLLHWIFDILFPWTITIAASVQGRHEVSQQSTGTFNKILLVDDVLDALTIDAVPNTLRDLSLEVFTLINYDGPFTRPSGEDKRPLNRRHIDTIVDLSVLLWTWLLVKVYPRDRYTYPTDSRLDDLVGVSWIGFGIGVNVIFTGIGAFLGTLLGFAVGRAEDPKVFGTQMARSIIPNLFLFWLNVYVFGEGDTSDGTYNPRGDDFDGYPDPDGSPYSLPYAPGKPILCDQGNQGMWSHNDMAGTFQVYAYDFALDQDQLILAARDGTVVDYFDWVPNDTDPSPATPSGLPAASTPPSTTTAERAPSQTASSSWNFVLVRHDDPFGNETADQKQDHDKGPGGTQMVTYAVYGHGRTDGVREVLQPCTSNNLPQEIVGLRVQKGQPLMKTGNTGNSAHNHLHIDIRAHKTQPDPMVAAPDAVPQGDLDDFTIPFVFKEVKNFFGKDGVCKAIVYYESENEQKGCAP